MYLIKKQKNEILSLACTEISADKIKTASSKLAQKILLKLNEKEAYPKELAKSFNIHEQKIYYHIKKLEKAGLIHPTRTETHQGALAKYYALSSPSFAIKFQDFKETLKISQSDSENKFLEPFIQKGQLNAKIIIGSPDPHGLENAKARDEVSAMELAFFLGSFLHHIEKPSIILDTQVQSFDLKNNLIILGGPIVNSITEKINSKLPIRFSKKSLYSAITKKTYNSDKNGVIQKIENPFDKTKSILIIAGLRGVGTRACILALIRHLKELETGNLFDKKIESKLIEGIDINSDGFVDDIKIIE